MAPVSSRPPSATNAIFHRHPAPIQVQTCCHPGHYRVSFLSGKGPGKGAICRSTTSGTDDVETSPEIIPQSPFSAGKISSKVAARKSQQEAASSSTAARVEVKKPPATPNEGPSLPQSPRKKAFAAPAVSSPFESDIRRRSRPGFNNDIDDSILASRKEILNALWKEKQDSTRSPAPVDIFDEPKPINVDDSKFKLIYGTNQLLVLASFSLIAGLMICTAFVTWKLGAIHFNEL